MALPTTRQLPYEPEKIKSDNKDEVLSFQKKSVREQTLMYEDIAKEHNALGDRVTTTETDITTLDTRLDKIDATGTSPVQLYGIGLKRPTAGSLTLYEDADRGIEICDGGIVHTAYQSGCRVYKNGTRTLTHNTWMNYQMDSESWDVQAEYDTTTYKFTAQKAGKYYAHFQVLVSDNKSITYTTSIYVNGAAVLKGYALSATGCNPGTCPVSGILNLAASDYVEFYVHAFNNTDGADMTTVNDGTFSYAVVQKVA